MKAIIQDRYGSIDDLRIADVERPEPGAHEVLVRIEAAGVHADIWHVVTGLPYVLRLFGSGLFKPACTIPGLDMAGVVEAVGEGVTRFAPGDAVYGETHDRLQWVNGGCFAEFVCARENNLAKKPDNLSFEEAASIVTSGMITLFNLRSVYPQAGQRILINGAAGSVGTVALQVGKAAGAHVTAVDSGTKLGLLSELGADRVIDYREQTVLEPGAGYDLIFDVASTLPMSACKQALREGGKYVMIGRDHFGQRGRHILGSIPALIGRTISGWKYVVRDMDTKFNKPELMKQLSDLLSAGHLTPRVGRRYPLEDAQRALQDLVEGKVLGRQVLMPRLSSE